MLDRAISRVLGFAEEGNGPLVLLTTLRQRRRRGGLLPRRALRRAARATARSSPPPPSTRWPPRRPATRRWCSPPVVMGAPVRPAAPGVRRAPGAGAHPPDLVDADGALPAAAVPARPRAELAVNDIPRRRRRRRRAGRAGVRPRAGRPRPRRAGARGVRRRGRPGAHRPRRRVHARPRVPGAQHRLPRAAAVRRPRRPRPAGVRPAAWECTWTASGSRSATRCSGRPACRTLLAVPVGGVYGQAATGLYAGAVRGAADPAAQGPRRRQQRRGVAQRGHPDGHGRTACSGRSSPACCWSRA